MTKEAILRKQIKEQKAVLNNLRQQLDEVKPNKQFSCPSCGKRSKIKGVTLIEEYWYDNATYQEGWNFHEYGIVCPKCNNLARCVDNRDRDYEHEPWITWFKNYELAHKYHDSFGEILKWYPRSRGLFGEVFDLNTIRKENSR